MDDALEHKVQNYYRTVSRYIDREHGGAPDAAFWEGIAREHRGGTALDLGCGTGRVAKMLAAELRWVVGADLSLEMLAGAGRGGHHVARVAADMRRLLLRRRFDLVVAANDPFAHLGEGEDRDAVLAVVAKHLADEEPGGRFVLDAHWFPPDHLELARSPGGLVSEHAGEGIDVRETWRCEPGGVCHARYEYLRGGERLEEARFDSRYWTVGEVEERFSRAGLWVTAVWGDWDRSPWDAEASRNLIVEARPKIPSRASKPG